jgi:WD40 repeat protein
VGSKVINAIAPQSTRTVASAEFDGAVRLYDCRLDAVKSIVAVLKCHSGPCMDLAWNPQNEHQVSQISIFLLGLVPIGCLQLVTAAVEDVGRNASASGCKQWDIRRLVL